MKPVYMPLKEHHWNAIPEDYRPRVCADTKGIIAIDEIEGLVAACILDSWSFNSCQIHIYIKNPFVLKHGFAKEVFSYVFGTCGRSIIIGVTPADNARALKFITNIGFVEVARIKDGYKEGVDFVITEIRKENCKWVEQTENPDGQISA